MHIINSGEIVYFCGNCLALCLVKRVIRPFTVVYPPDGKLAPSSITASCRICGAVSQGLGDEFYYHPDLDRLSREASTMVETMIERERKAAEASLKKSLEG